MNRSQNAHYELRDVEDHEKIDEKTLKGSIEQSENYLELDLIYLSVVLVHVLM